MKTILVNAKEIESCWETEDICCVKTTTGKVWLCQKEYLLYGISTFNFIKASFGKKELIELPLAQKGKGD